MSRRPRASQNLHNKILLQEAVKAEEHRKIADPNNETEKSNDEKRASTSADVSTTLSYSSSDDKKTSADTSARSINLFLNAEKSISASANASIKPIDPSLNVELLYNPFTSKTFEFDLPFRRTINNAPKVSTRVFPNSESNEYFSSQDIFQPRKPSYSETVTGAMRNAQTMPGTSSGMAGSVENMMNSAGVINSSSQNILCDTIEDLTSQLEYPQFTGMDPRAHSINTSDDATKYLEEIALMNSSSIGIVPKMPQDFFIPPITFSRSWRPVPPPPHVSLRRNGDDVLIKLEMPYNLWKYEEILGYELYYWTLERSWLPTKLYTFFFMPAFITLNNFTKSNRYGFMVRTVDIEKRKGIFSNTVYTSVDVDNKNAGK